MTTVTSGVQENLWSVWVSGTGVPFIVGSGGTALTINEDTVRPLNTIEHEFIRMGKRRKQCLRLETEAQF